MPSLSRLAPLVLLLGSVVACARPPEERAYEACRREVARRLVDPTSARFTQLKVERRSSDGASVVDGWDVDVIVDAYTGDKKRAKSSIRCKLGDVFELLDLSGEQASAER